MDKAAHLQNQVRQNNTELTDFLKDLTRWEEKVKYEDKNLKTARKFEEKLPPVRSKVKKPKVVPANKKVTNEKPKEKSDRISSYDYDAWAKFDAEAACKSVSGEENGDGDEEEDEEDEVEDAEELEIIQQEKSLQKAVMEKDKGNQLFKEGKYEAAINRYTSAIGFHPCNPVLYANRGMALIKTEKYGAAEQDCNVALQLDPSYGKAIARRATARKKLKKYKEALEDFTHLLEVEPKNQQAVQEIKDIKKLLLTAKESCEKGDDSGIQLKSLKATEKQQVKHTHRSNKPLKRIHITEVGIDEPSNEKTEKICLKNDRVPQVVHDVSQTNGSPELSIPTTSFMFETEFKRLKNEDEKLYSYLKIIPLTDYGKLFYQCIDTLISAFINILKDYYIRDNASYHEEMDTFTTIKRFNMAIMFLSRKDKETLGYLFNNLSSDAYKYPLEEEFIKTLAKKYSVKL